jgi:hypothetical protein
MLKDTSVNGAEEAFRIDAHLGFLPAVAMVHGRLGSCAAIGGDGEVRISKFLPQSICECVWHIRVQRNLVQGVTIAFEESGFLSVQTENLIAVGRLKDAHQGLEMKAVRHYDQFGDGPLQSVDPKHSSCAKHRQPVKGMIPHVAVVRQCQERVQECLDLSLRDLLQERLLQSLHKDPEPNSILLIVRTVPMRRLVERKARRVAVLKESRREVLVECVHVLSSCRTVSAIEVGNLLIHCHRPARADMANDVYADGLENEHSHRGNEAGRNSDGR